LVVIGRGRMIGEYSMDEFLAGGSRVLVETPDARHCDVLGQKLRTAGFSAGYGVGDDNVDQFMVEIPSGESESDVRRAVAEIALTSGVPVTGLSTQSDDLETRFLAATSGAQEYRTDALVGAGTTERN
ncbi:MAG: ABC transporter ATP-binding protein, partial [Corynebacterium sp.]